MSPEVPFYLDQKWDCSIRMETYNPNTEVGSMIDQNIPCDSFVKLTIDMAKNQIDSSAITQSEIIGLTVTGTFLFIASTFGLVAAIQHRGWISIIPHLVRSIKRLP